MVGKGTRAQQKALRALRHLRDATDAAEAMIQDAWPSDNAAGALVTSAGNALMAIGALQEEEHQLRIRNDPEYAAKFQEE